MSSSLSQTPFGFALVLGSFVFVSSCRADMPIGGTLTQTASSTPSLLGLSDLENGADGEYPTGLVESFCNEQSSCQSLSFRVEGDESGSTCTIWIFTSPKAQPNDTLALAGEKQPPRKKSARLAARDQGAAVITIWGQIITNHRLKPVG